ncbi:Calx-beta domain-containing protein [Sediminicoccus sp. BL-A-41-H5]|uniref:Calx-beta domain-containing protein n=1 Tax=Sediminicoccus sp. BL-A-41-H5 TaxID=3421106 RepID=UPI003D66629B
MSSTISFASTGTTPLITEGGSGATRAVFTVLRGGDTSGTAEARWAVVASQTNAADFVGGVLPSGTVTFAAGESSKTIEIDIAGDTLVENNENFTVTLSAPVGTVFLTQTQPTATATIVNDDGAILSVSPTPARGYEGNATNGVVEFTVTRGGDTSIAASANWAVSSGFNPMGGSATAADFVGGVLPGGTVNFAAGETSRVIRVETLADTTAESSETFTLTLSNPSTGAVLLTASASGTIVNDDGPTTLGFSGTPGTITEGQSGVTDVTFTVIRTGDPTQAVSVNWTVTSMGIGGWVNGADFVGGALPSGSVSFAAGEMARTITVSISGDTEIEPAEQFTLTLTSPDNSVALVNQSGTFTIGNDDGAFLALAPSRAHQTTTFASLGTVNEGNAGSTPASFMVTRSGDLSGTVSATWSILPAPVMSFQPSANGADFVGGEMSSGVVSFGPGETSKIITLQIRGDTQLEAEEYFTVQLSAPSAGAILPGTFTNSFAIRNDDAATVLSLGAGAVSQAEGNAGSTAFTFTVTREGVTTTAASANWAVTSASANGADFTGGVLPSGTVSFAAGETSRTITIQVAGDANVEPDESFTLTLASPTGASLGVASATGIIENDDAGPPATLISIAALSADRTEGRSGSTPFTFIVTRTGELGEASSVQWAVTGRGGSPATGGDFVGSVLPSGTVSFAAGEVSRIITVGVLGDGVIEGDEGFTVTLSAPVNGALGEASAQGTIRNDDAAVSLRPALERSTSFVATGTEDTLLNLDVAETRDGGFIAVWEFQDRAAAGGPVLAQTSLAQRFDATGQALAPAQLLTSVAAASFGLGIASSPSVSVGTHGGTVLAWSPMGTVPSFNGPNTASTGVIAVQRNDAAGNLIGTTLVTAGGAEDRVLNLDVAAGADGGFLLAWEIQDLQPGEPGARSQTAYVQRFGADGVALAPAQVAFTVSASGYGVTHTSSPSVSFGADGGSLLAWNPLGLVASSPGPITAPSNQILVERRDGSGELRGVTAITAGGVEDTVLGLDVAGGPDGGFTLSWEIQDRATPGGLILAQSGYTQRFDAAGQALAPAQLLTSTAAASFQVTLEISPSASMGAEGGTTLAWHPLTTVLGSFGVQTNSSGVIQVSAVKPAGTPSVIEGQEGTTPFSFLVTREGNIGLAASVSWAVQGSGANPVDGADFVGGVLPSGVLNFAAGEASRLITLQVQGDRLAEMNEGFVIALSAASSGLRISGGTLAGIIANDDAIAGTDAADRLTGGSFADLIRGQEGHDRIRGEAGNDTLEGGAGDDTLAGGLGADRLLGGTGDDTYYVDNPGDVVVELADAGQDRVFTSVSHTLAAHVERLSLSGTAGINGTGNGLANRMDGNAGANRLDGGLGDDSLAGGAGRDSLIGGEGNDRLDGGLDADEMAGGRGDDIYIVDHADDVVVELADEGQDHVLASLSHTLAAHVERLTLSGTAGINGTGNGLVNRMDGNDGANLLSGLDGDDSLTGGAGNDTLIGGAGRDVLRGGLGADRLEGGLEADRFVFGSALEADGDLVVDFSGAQQDRIELRAMDANSLVDGNQSFTWLGSAAFTGAAGQLRFADSILAGDVNGDGVADFQITLSGVTSLATSNIWL